MNNNKKTVVYARTASENSNINIQLDAAKPFLEKIEPESLFYIIDKGVRINSQSKGNGFQELLSLIKQNQVDTLIVYNRDRLTRSVDQYIELINTIKRHKVNVIFTATEHSSNISNKLEDLYTEGIYALITKFEGVMMSNRIKDGIRRKQEAAKSKLV